jgi:uncharacterized phage protein (TIGR02218 family)
MMKAVSTAMLTALTGYRFFIAELYTLTLLDGSVYRFTSGDGDVQLGVSTQPYTLLAHFNDVTGSTTIADSGGQQHLITAVNNNMITAADSVFGSRSGDLGVGTANNYYFSFAETPSLNFANYDFTLRCRCKVTNTAGGKVHTLFSNGYGLTINWLADTAKFQLLLSYNGTSYALTLASSSAYPYGYWYALSVEVYQGQVYLYINGLLACTPVALTAPIYYQLNRTMTIGGSGAMSFWGRVDEFLIYNGVAMAHGASSYTVETQPFTDTVVTTLDYAVGNIRIERGDISTATGVSVDDCTVTLNCNADSVINGNPVQAYALIGGFDNAHIKIELLIMPEYGDTSFGAIHLFEGRVTDVVLDVAKVDLTVSSETTLLNVSIPKVVYQPTCSHTLYDAQCGVNRAAFTQTATVLAYSNKGNILFATLNGVGFFTLGKLTFTSGLNVGLSRTVKWQFLNAGIATARLTTDFPFAPAVGDTFTISAGCDKLRSTCTAKFSNTSQFLGFEYMPVPEASV